MAIRPEALAASVFRDYLLLALPQKLSALNATRLPVLKAPRAGPYDIPLGAKLVLRMDALAFSVTLTPGTREATEVAADISASGFAGASVDYRGRLLLTGGPPVSGVSRLELASESEAGSVAGLHAVFGFDAGGNRSLRTPVLPPTLRAVYDGFPVQADFPGGGTLCVVLGDRRSAPQTNVRRDMHDVDLTVHLLRAEPLATTHASREGIQACLQAVRELIHESRTLDESETSDRHIMLTEVSESEVGGRPLVLENLPALYFDAAQLRLKVRVYERS